MTEIEVTKRQIEAQIADYLRALAEAAAFLDGWRRRHDPAHQRLERFRRAKQQEATA